MATVQEQAYAAGLFDGEGHIDTLARMRMAIKMTDRDAVDFMKDVFGGNMYQWNDTDTGRSVYEWRASGWDGAVEVAKQILPYSVTKKHQLEVVVGCYDYTSKYGYPNEVRRIASTQLRALRAPAVHPAFWDLETMGLDWLTLPILTGGVEVNRTLHLYNRLDGGERSLVMSIRDALESAPYSVGWNSHRFDVPYLNSRLLYWDERPAFLGSHISGDVVFDKKFGNKRRTSLKNAAIQLGLIDEEAYKTEIDWGVWNAADMGDYAAVSEVLKHNRMDVILTRRVYEAITA